MYSYKGIPFAQPPTGNLRFRAPVARSPWAGRYQAVEFAPNCPQMTSRDTVIGQEDCLYLVILFLKVLWMF